MDCTDQFQEVQDVDEGLLWLNPRIYHRNLGRIRLRTVETVLRMDFGSTHVIQALADASHLSGLRVIHRDEVQGSLIAERSEALYLTNLSKGRRSIGGRGYQRNGRVDAMYMLGLRSEPVGGKEWHVLVANLGVSRLARQGCVERVLRLDFMTDMYPPQVTERGALSTARSAGASIAGKLSTAAAGFGVGFGKRETSGGATSAVAFAQHRSNQRADALVEAVTTEICRIGAIPKDQVVRPAGDDGRDEEGLSGEEGKTLPKLELVRYTDGDAWENDAGFNRADAPQNENPTGDEDGASTRVKLIEHVKFDLQYVECLCARAREASRQDAHETWLPLENTMRGLQDLRKIVGEAQPQVAQPDNALITSHTNNIREKGNSSLRHLLEPRFRAAGVHPPSPPRWVDNSVEKCRLGLETEPAPGETETLLGSSPFFVVEDGWVKATIGVGVQDTDSEHSPAGVSSISLSAAPVFTTDTSFQSSLTYSTVTRVACHLTEVISRACEAKSEQSTKDRMRVAQEYVGELEAYRSRLVGNLAMSQVPNGGSGELERSFGTVTEALLYSAPAALGKKPGRIYVTRSTLWFHSKVLNFESRYILQMSDISKVEVLCTAMDISASLLLVTAAREEVMFIFPGQGKATLEPLELLIHQLLTLVPCEQPSK